MAFDYGRFNASEEMLRANASRLDAAFASGLRPPERMSVSEWAVRYRKFPADAEYSGGWQHETAPYLVEIMDCVSPHHPAREVSILKCAQSGGSAAAEILIGYVADISPANMLYVQATVRAGTDWARDKLWPMIRATARLGADRTGAIAPRAKSDAEGSTQHRIKFRRGESGMLLAGSNSAATLRSHSVRYAIEDDLDSHADDVEGQGSSEGMVTARLRVATRTGRAKRLKISTPTVKGASKIGTAYEASDKRRFHLRCPGCESRFDPDFADLQWPKAPSQPRLAHLVAPCCGTPIEHWQKRELSLFDGWLATAEIDGEKPPRFMDEATFQDWRKRPVGDLQPGFHITGIISSFMLWADLCQGFLAAQGDVHKLMTWTNLDLGNLFEVKGSAPDFEKLKALREQHWGRGQLPYGPVCTTMGVDVQGDGLYYEIVAWAENGESWSIDAGFLPGATDVAGEGAWVDLETVARRKVAYPGGKTFGLDQVCVDAGYHTASAEAFCRSHSNRLPVFGRAGWTLPVLGRGENLRYERQGKRTGQGSKRSEDKAYIVGTFGVKQTFFGFLRSTIEAAAEEVSTGVEHASRGRCHFSRDAQDQWFEQITAETIMVTVVNGYPRREWKPLPGRQNHWLDCRVYNHAAAEKLMLDTLSDAEWAALRAGRYAAADPVQGDLLALAARPAPIMAAVPPDASAARIADAQPVPVHEDWIAAADEEAWI